MLGTDIFSERYGTVLARLRPWTPAELDRLARLARERGDGVAFAPGGPYRLEWARPRRGASSPLAFCAGYRLDVCPPTDDKPVLLQHDAARHVGDAPPPGYVYSVDPFLVLLVTLGDPRGARGGGVRGAAGARAARGPPAARRRCRFFAAIGLGFLVLEVVLIQRFVLFLGFPTYALSVVLFSLLLFTGAGSLAVGAPRRAARGRWSARSPRRSC